MATKELLNTENFRSMKTHNKKLDPSVECRQSLYQSCSKQIRSLKLKIGMCNYKSSQIGKGMGMLLLFVIGRYTIPHDQSELNFFHLGVFQFTVQIHKEQYTTEN